MLGKLSTHQTSSLVICMELNAHRVPFLFVEKKFPVCGWWEQELGLCLPGICEKVRLQFSGTQFSPSNFSPGDKLRSSWSCGKCLYPLSHREYSVMSVA